MRPRGSCRNKNVRPRNCGKGLNEIKKSLRQEKREELWRKLQARREQLEALPEELWRKLQARREQLEALPEGIKIVVGVAIGIVAIAALFAIIVMLAPK